jgi:polysulfide reductase chain C
MASTDRPMAAASHAVTRQTDWAWNVGLYLALSSAGAGAYVAWHAGGALDPSFAAAGRAGAALGIVLVMVGALLILFDLGRWSRFYRAAARPGASWESRAFLLIVAFTLLGGLQFSGWLRSAAAMTLLSLALIVVAGALLLYGALLLRGMRAYALWGHPLQLALYPAGGLLAGCGVLALDPLGALAPVHGQWLAVALALLAALNALLLAVVVRQTRRAGVAGMASANALLAGVHCRLFWAGAIGCGLALPFVLAVPVAAGWAGAPILRVAGACAVAGLGILRFTFLAAAHRPRDLTFRGAGPWGMTPPPPRERR